MKINKFALLIMILLLATVLTSCDLLVKLAEPAPNTTRADSLKQEQVPSNQPISTLKPGESVVVIFSSGSSSETGRQMVPIRVDEPRQYTIVLENANPTGSGYWIIWDYISLEKGNTLIWEIGEDEAPPDYSDKAFSEFCDPQPPKLQDCTTEFTIASTKAEDFSKDFNDGEFPTARINFTLTEKQLDADLMLVLSTLYSTHPGIDHFKMKVTLEGGSQQ